MTEAMPAYPPSPQHTVTETLHGHKISDDYRWLEDDSQPEVREWIAEQNAYTRRILDALPGRAPLEARMRQLVTIGALGAPTVRGERHFYTRREGEQNQPALYVRDGVAGRERVLLDPNSAHQHATVALDWWYPSDDGKLLAYGYSEHGDEKSTLYVINVDSGEPLADTIPHTRYSSLAWQPSGAGFYYTRYPSPGDVPAGEENYHQHLFYHRLGDDYRNDPKLFGEGRDMTEQPYVVLSPDGRWLVMMVFQGWAKTAMYLRDLSQPDGQFIPLVEDVAAIFTAEVMNDQLYILTNHHAPHYQVMVADLSQPQMANWRVLIAEREDTTIVGAPIIGGRLVLDELREVASALSIYALTGEPLGKIDIPPLGSVMGLGGEWNGEAAYILYESYTTAPTVYRYDLNKGELSVWAKVDLPLDTSRFKVEQVWYTSKDGTRIPMSIIMPRDSQRNGSTPLILNGYGGFNVSRTPIFIRSLMAWLERGGMYAVANLRGGGEFGEDWHRAGTLERKQNVFDDFIAAAEYLVSAGYTSHDQLGLMGGSNGGLLMGAMMTQRPDLCRAIVCAVPLLDMLRFHLFRIAKLWVPEYGSADDPEQFAFLHAYSPYHHIAPGTRYPAILFTAAESDGRVDPLHARKMTAAMQAANASPYPIMLRLEQEAGHGVGKPVYKQVDEQVDIWSFFADQLGLSLSP